MSLFCFILIIESVARFFPIFLSSTPNKKFKLFIYLQGGTFWSLQNRKKNVVPFLRALNTLKHKNKCTHIGGFVIKKPAETTLPFLMYCSFYV